MENIIVSTNNITLEDDISDDDCENTCGICSEEYNKDSEDYIKLDCGHEYHYTCLSNYFVSIINTNKGNIASTNNGRECPYCRQINTLLPIKMDIAPFKGVHKIVSTKKPSTNINRCLAICKSGKKCKNRGKAEYNGYCGLHKNKMNSE